MTESAEHYQERGTEPGAGEQPGGFQAGGESREGDYGYRDQESYPDEQPGGWGPEDKGARPGVPLGREDQQPPPDEVEQKSQS